MTDGIEQEGFDGYDEDLVGAHDIAQGGDELVSERERREHAEAQALIARHPELGEQENVARLIGAAADVAQEYGLDPGVVHDARFLGLVADHYEVGDQQQPDQPRDPFDTIAALDEAAAGNGLPFK